MVSRGFKITAIEAKSLEAALTRYREYAALNATLRGSLSEPDRKAFTELAAASKKLVKALDPFASNGNSPERQRLANLMREAELFSSGIVHYLDMIDALYEPLSLISASVKAASKGAGVQQDHRTTCWVLMAAKEWESGVGNRPSSATSGRFFQALSDFQSQNREVPTVTERQLRTVFEKKGG